MSAATREERFEDAFCDLATQYYAAARLAAKTQLSPIHGNLFHHAVELFLKCALVGTLSIAQMKNPPYSHSLRALWDRFKQKEGDPHLDRFDSTITELDAFEWIRYPDKFVEEGMRVAITYKAGDVGQATGTAKMPPSYSVVIEEIDHLVIEVMRRASRNPKAYITRINHPVALDAVTFENPESRNWVS